MSRKLLEDLYTGRIEKYNALSLKIRKWLNVLVVARLLLFALAVFFLIIGFRDGGRFIYLSAFLFFMAGFLFAVKRSVKLSAKKRYFDNLTVINKKEIQAINNDFRCFDDGREFSDPSHPFAYDLDLFGEGSVFQQINRTITEYGKSLLAKWFLNPLMTKEVIGNRQEAVIELANNYELRQNFMAGGMGKEDNRKPVMEWLKKDISKKDYVFYRTISAVFSAVSILVIFAVSLHWLDFGFLFWLLAWNGFFGFLKIKHINTEHATIGRQYDMVMLYAEQIKLLENMDFRSTILSELKLKIKGVQGIGSQALSRLASIINRFDYRLNFLASIILNGFFFWDFFCMIWLYGWKKRYGEQITDWFEALDVFDALQSMANFRFNNPAYSFPDIVEDGFCFQAKDIGHPDISPDQRIVNDLEINNQGEFLIVTGPNMAGKSTFLRTVGASIVLSQIGAPFCAGQLKMSPVSLFSGMRTADSLFKKESYFFAELKRLKEIIGTIQTNKNVFIILDEILKGTNSTDKAEGSTLFLRKITKMGATGIVATHDLSLSKLEQEMPGQIKNYCFETETDGDLIDFDYKLKRGVTTKMNASVLMKKMGIV